MDLKKYMYISLKIHLVIEKITRSEDNSDSNVLSIK